MAAISDTEIQTQLTAALAGLTAARLAYRYAIGDRSVERQRLKEANADVDKWEAKAEKRTRGGISIVGITTN